MFGVKVNPGMMMESMRPDFIDLKTFLNDETIKKYADKEAYEKSKRDTLKTLCDTKLDGLKQIRKTKKYNN